MRDEVSNAEVDTTVVDGIVDDSTALLDAKVEDSRADVEAIDALLTKDDDNEEVIETWLEITLVATDNDSRVDDSIMLLAIDEEIAEETTPDVETLDDCTPLLTDDANNDTREVWLERPELKTVDETRGDGSDDTEEAIDEDARTEDAVALADCDEDSRTDDKIVTLAD